MNEIRLPGGFVLDEIKYGESAIPLGFQLDSSVVFKSSFDLPAEFVLLQPEEDTSVYILDPETIRSQAPEVYVLDEATPIIQGMTGVSGPEGRKGAIGPQGMPGRLGPGGPMGVQGLRGAKGNSGEDAPPLEWEFCDVTVRGNTLEDGGIRFRKTDGSWSKCKRIVGVDGKDGRDGRAGANALSRAGAGAGGGAAGGGGTAPPASAENVIIRDRITIGASGTTVIVTTPTASNIGLKWFLRVEDTVTGSAQSSELYSHLNASVVSFDTFRCLGADMNFVPDITASNGNWIFDITNNGPNPLDVRLSRLITFE